MSISREHIIKEIQRTAAENNGKPLGRNAFFSATGIKESDWIGRFWARWSDVIKDAGFSPNKLNEAFDEELLLNRFAEFSMELGRIPVYSELSLKRRADKTFPSAKTFARLGTKAQLLARLHEYCSSRPIFAALLPKIQEKFHEDDAAEGNSSPSTGSVEGFVYLVKMGKHYKIGKTFSVPRRHREIALELPEKLEPVHVIRTDDPAGIEAYWHKRFQSKCTNGEWFALSAEDVRVFRRRKFM